MANFDVIIVGGGMSGLACANHLYRSGVSFQIFEAADKVGGRVRTDQIDGYLLDRGFQVLLTAYPEARELFDYKALDLKNFEPGALVRFDGKFHRLVDPWRRPQHVLTSALSPIFSLADKLRLAQLRRRVTRGSIDELLERPETTTREALRNDQFTKKIVDRFFQPFLAGIFLESELSTSSRKFEFVFRMFSEGHAALPANGIEAMAKQLAERLPQESIKTNSPVEKIEGTTIHLSDGESHIAQKIILACDGPATSKLLGKEPTPHHDVICIYFSADRPPIKEPLLVLNGDGQGPINNLSVPSQIAPHYAPKGKSLISVSVVNGSESDEQILQKVNRQLKDWFGTETQYWKHLKTYRIPCAIPSQPAGTLDPVAKHPQHSAEIHCCGDAYDIASLQGALASGRRAAEAVTAQLVENNA